MNVPPHRNAAMDGYALAGEDLPTDNEKIYRVEGSAFAGVPTEYY